MSVTIGGDYGVLITVPERGVTYRGPMMWGLLGPRLTVVQSGGADDGRTWTFQFHTAF